MKGIKKVAGLTQHYCKKDGYGIKIQGFTTPRKTKFTDYLK